MQISIESSTNIQLVIGLLKAPLMWQPNGNHPDARIHIICPYCGKRDWHGWRLTGETRTESRRSHCSGGGEYQLRPALSDELGIERHQFDPGQAITRAADGRISQ